MLKCILRKENADMEQLKKDIKSIFPGLAAAAAVCTVLTLVFGTCCPMRILTGLPCPACGTLRSILALLRLDIGEMLWYQPVLPLVLAAFLFFCYIRYYKKQSRKKLFYTMISLIILISCAVYVYRMRVYYPNRPPLEYTHGNLLENIGR